MTPLLSMLLAASWSGDRTGDFGTLSFVAEVQPTIVAEVEQHDAGELVAYVIRYDEVFFPTIEPRSESAELLAYADDGVEFTATGDALIARRWRRDGWPEEVVAVK